MKKFELSKVMGNVGTSISKVAGKTGLKIKKYSPEILLAVGVVTEVAAIVSAVKAAKNHDQIIADHEDRLEIAKLGYTPEELDEIKEGTEVVAIDDQKIIRKKVTKCYIKTAGNLAKNYALTAAFSGVSMASFIGMHNIQAGRIAGLSTAYTGLKEGFDRYVKNNIELNGEENHRKCKYGFDKDTKETVSIDGEKQTIEETAVKDLESVKDAGYYADSYWFDKQSSPMFKGMGNYDIMSLDAAEEYINALIETRGWATLNDVFDNIGMQRTKDGMIEGWVKGKGGRACLGHHDPINQKALDGKMNQPILLSPNVHGNVFAMI